MIDTIAIKNKILGFALTGQLTERDNDTGASVDLYSRIVKRRQELEKSGLIKKEKALSAPQDEDKYFEIPEMWKWVHLGEIFLHNTGKALNASDTEGELLEYITTSNMYWDRFELDNLKQMRFKPEEIDKCTITFGDLLICEGGDIGRAAIWKYDYDMRIQNHIHKLRGVIPEETCVEFFYYLMMLYKQNDWINGRGIGLQGFSSKRLHSLVVPLPSYDEQKRIVKRIEELFAEINSIDDLQGQYRKDSEILKKKLIDAGIEGRLTEQLDDDGDSEDLYERMQNVRNRKVKEGMIRKQKKFPAITDENLPYHWPISWKICYIDDIAFVTKLAGFEYTKNIADNIQEQGIPLFKGKNVQNGKIVLEFESFIPETVSDELPRSQLTKKCLLTPYVGTIGNIAIFDGDFRAHLGSNVGKIEVLNDDGVCLLEEYLLYYLRSSLGYSELTKHKKATAQDSISIDAIRNVIIAIPPLEEQKRLVKKLDGLLENILE